MLNISEKAVFRLHADGRLRGQKCDDHGQFLYEAPINAPLRTPKHAAWNNIKHEVQYGA